ncbi:MAG: YbjN domain-containing protein [Anaerolineae bacterium]|nr:YbjN domain-containing protein [Anaerolineae bacterium]
MRKEQRRHHPPTSRIGWLVAPRAAKFPWKEFFARERTGAMTDQLEENTILETVTRFFQEDGWPFEQLEGKPILRTGFRGDNGNWRCFAQAREGQEQFVFYSILDTYVPENRRQATANFLTRANYGLIIGNFELDMSDGEVRYKTSVDVEGDRLSTALVKQMVYINVMMMDRYLPGIMKVAFGEIDPLDAIVEIEGE